MCVAIINEHPSCKCRWLQISSQCQPNAGFSQCPRFGKGRITYEPEEFESLQCPIHDLCGFYDQNFVRLIVKEKYSLRVGCGPRKKDPGFDLRCIVM